MIAFNYKEAAQELEDEEFSRKEIEDVLSSTFLFLRNTMKEGNLKTGYKNVRIFNLGIFAVKSGRLEYFKKKLKEKGEL